MNTLLAIFIGGGLGSLARYGIGSAMSRWLPGTFPYGTLAANVIGSLILGIFLGFAAGKTGTGNNLRFFVAVGFCGGFSTFSTFSAETFEFIRNGLFLQAGFHIAAHVIICLAMIAVGIWLGRQF